MFLMLSVKQPHNQEVLSSEIFRQIKEILEQKS